MLAEAGGGVGDPGGGTRSGSWGRVRGDVRDGWQGDRLGLAFYGARVVSGLVGPAQGGTEGGFAPKRFFKAFTFLFFSFVFVLFSISL